MTQLSGFELQDHTADIALHAWGDSLQALFAAAADGLYATIGELEVAGESRERTIELTAPDVSSLLQSFLTELLFRFETSGLVLRDLRFDRMESTKLKIRATARSVDVASSKLDREVKAVTYHDLHVTQRDGRYTVTVVLDI